MLPNGIVHEDELALVLRVGEVGVFRRHAVPLLRIVDARLVAPDQRDAVGLAVLDQPGRVLEGREKPGGVRDARHVERLEEIRPRREDGALEILVRREQVERAATAGVEPRQRLVAGHLEGRLHLDVVLGEEVLGDIGAVLAVPAEIVELAADAGEARRAASPSTVSVASPVAPWMNRRRLKSALSLLFKRPFTNSFTLISMVRGAWDGARRRLRRAWRRVRQGIAGQRNRA